MINEVVEKELEKEVEDDGNGSSDEIPYMTGAILSASLYQKKRHKDNKNKKNP